MKCSPITEDTLVALKRARVIDGPTMSALLNRHLTEKFLRGVFDPFHDFEVAGYLRNVHGNKSAVLVKHHEHNHLCQRRHRPGLPRRAR